VLAQAAPAAAGVPPVALAALLAILVSGAVSMGLLVPDDERSPPPPPPVVGTETARLDAGSEAEPRPGVEPRASESESEAESEEAEAKTEAEPGSESQPEVEREASESEFGAAAFLSRNTGRYPETVVIGWDSALGPLTTSSPHFVRLVGNALFHGIPAEAKLSRRNGIYSLGLARTGLAAPDLVARLGRLRNLPTTDAGLYANERQIALAQELRPNALGHDTLELGAGETLGFRDSELRRRLQSAPFRFRPAPGSQDLPSDGLYIVTSMTTKEVVLERAVPAQVANRIVIHALVGDEPPTHGFDVIWSARWAQGYVRIPLGAIGVELRVHKKQQVKAVAGLMDFTPGPVGGATLIGQPKTQQARKQRHFEQTTGTALHLAYTRDDLRLLAAQIASHLESRRITVELAAAAGRPERGLILCAGLEVPLDNWVNVFSLGRMPASLVPCERGIEAGSVDLNGWLNYPPEFPELDSRELIHGLLVVTVKAGPGRIRMATKALASAGTEIERGDRMAALLDAYLALAAAEVRLAQARARQGDIPRARKAIRDALSTYRKARKWIGRSGAPDGLIDDRVSLARELEERLEAK
jgi:hypothetical protein